MKRILCLRSVTSLRYNYSVVQRMLTHNNKCQLLCSILQKSFGEECAGVLPVEFGSLDQGVGIPVLNHHPAAQTHKALGVVLVLSGHLQPQTNWADLQDACVKRSNVRTTSCSLVLHCSGRCAESCSSHCERWRRRNTCFTLTLSGIWYDVTSLRVWATRLT